MDWLIGISPQLKELALPAIAIRLGTAFCFGFVISAIYRATNNPHDKPEESFHTTLVLLTVIIAMSTQVIGDHIARAFSLVGALSIVRFRTAVQDTRDIAFVIFAVVVGMAAGVGNFAVALLGVPVTGLAAWMMRPSASSTARQLTRSSLKIGLGAGRDPKSVFTQVFAKYLAAHSLRSTFTNPHTDTFELTYLVRFQPDCSPTEFIEEIRQIEGVNHIKLSAANR